MSLFLPLTFLTLSYFGAFYSVNVMFKLPMQFVPLGYSSTLLSSWCIWKHRNNYFSSRRESIHFIHISSDHQLCSKRLQKYQQKEESAQQARTPAGSRAAHESFWSLLASTEQENLKSAVAPAFWADTSLCSFCSPPLYHLEVGRKVGQLWRYSCSLLSPAYMHNQP